MEQIREAENQLDVPLQELETQRAAARSMQPGEEAGAPLPQCRAVAKRIARDRDLARDLDEAELERLTVGVLEQWVQLLDEQSRQPGADEVEQRHRARRIGQLPTSIRMKQLQAEGFAGSGGGSGAGGGRGGGIGGGGGGGRGKGIGKGEAPAPKRARAD